MFTDDQFSHLAEHLHITDPNLLAGVRDRLDFIREFYLTGRIYRKATPSQRARNAALSILNTRIEKFLTMVALLEPHPNWSVAEQEPIEGPSPIRIFMSFPQRLTMLASVAVAIAKNISDQSYDSVLLLYLSNTAAALADTLFLLDHASRADVIGCLPWTRDYDMGSFSEVVGMARRLGQAVGVALASGRKRGGPTPFPELLQTVAWLGKVFESCGGRVTHTPRLKTEYDGIPHSAAGCFLIVFFEICDKSLPSPTICSALEAVIRNRNSSDD
jgi:hypothetical protein